MIAGSTPAILFSISALSLYFIERCRRNITPPFCQIRGVYHYPTLLPIYSRNSAGTIFSIFSNLPNNSFTSIFAVFPSYRGVVTLQVRRCLRGLHGRTRSSLAVWRKIFPASCGCEVFFVKTLYVLTSTPKSP